LPASSPSFRLRAPRRAAAAIAILLASVTAFASSAAAQTAGAFPSRAIRIVVPSAAGGGTDILARVLAQKLTERLGQPVVVENRPGAGQMIGTELVAKSPPDGHTLVMAASTLVLNPLMYARVPYDAQRDLAPIALVATLANVVVVHPSLRVSSLAELLALAKGKPGSVPYASAGVGTSPHLSIVLLESLAGISLVHVPYKGTGPAVADVLSGQVPLVASNVLTALPHLRAGRLRALGVTSATRVNALPEVPTIAEAGVPGYAAVQWYGLLGPAGTPTAAIERLNAEVVRALDLPDVRERLAADGAEPAGGTPEAFGRFIAEEVRKWAGVARAAGLKPE
jgi:tripartite-type tricarboxylate transporter receptor subunit TctC